MGVRRFVLEKPNGDIYAIGLLLDYNYLGNKKSTVQLTKVGDSGRPQPDHFELEECLQIPEVSTFRWLTGPDDQRDYELWARPEKAEYPIPDNLTPTERGIYRLLQRHTVIRKEHLGMKLKKKPKLLVAHITNLREKIKHLGLDIMNVGRSYILMEANLNQKRW